MGLGVVSRFSSLVEAEVACSALRSAGFHAEVFDHVFGTMRWTEQVALGGFRLVVPDQELTDAAECLADARRRAPEPEGRSPRGDVGWGVATLFVAMFLDVQAGWLLLALRNRLRLGRSSSFLEIAIAALAVGAVVIVSAVILFFIVAFIDGWLIHPTI